MGQWLAEADRDRENAWRELAAASPRQAVEEAEVRSLVKAIGDVAAKMAKATPAVKARVYEDLGLQITYSPAADHFVVEASPRVRSDRVGGGT